MHREDPETEAWNIVWNLRGKAGRVGGWEVISQRPCVHICTTHGHGQLGGESLGWRGLIGGKGNMYNTFNNKKINCGKRKSLAR